MRFPEMTFDYDGLSVTYRRRRSKQDRRHLIIVFSGGFGAKKGYDFDGSAVDGLRGEILWIRDRFNGEFSYYIETAQLGSKVEEAVQALIGSVRSELGLEKNNCTLVGFSKGGTGALYHGIKFDYENIISSVPRIRIGSGNRELRPAVLKGMIGNDSNEAVQRLDEMLPRLIATDQNLKRNIYLISSPADPQYETEIAPHLRSLEAYDNFNFICSSTPLVTRHKEVTAYNIPVILGIIALLTEGASPKIGILHNGSTSLDKSLPQQSCPTASVDTFVGGIDLFKVRDSRLYAEGHGFHKGREATLQSRLTTSLVLTSRSGTCTFALGSVKDPKLSATHYDGTFVDYSRGRWATIDHAGISLDEIPDGRYSVGLRVCQQEIESLSEQLSLPIGSSIWVSGAHLIRFTPANGGIEFLKRPLLSVSDPGAYFDLSKYWLEGNKLHIEGLYVVPGMETRSRQDVRYSIVLEPVGNIGSTKILPLGTSLRRGAGTLIGDDWGDYKYSYFASPGYAGLSLDKVEPGSYAVWVLAVSPDRTSSVRTDFIIHVSQDRSDAQDRLSLESEKAQIQLPPSKPKKRIEHAASRYLHRISAKLSMNQGLRRGHGKR